MFAQRIGTTQPLIVPGGKMEHEEHCNDPFTENVDLSDLDLDGPRPLEPRWAPVGANDVDDLLAAASSSHLEDTSYASESERLHHLEEEQEQLNASLLALTSHFAQVQFRLKQIVDASPEMKENLLRELEEFAFRGIPDTRRLRTIGGNASGKDGDDDGRTMHELKLSEQREKQKELIEQLKTQLEELERYAYETGDADMPQSMVMEKQKVIIDELKGKLPLNLEEFHSLNAEELRKQVDHAVCQLINPVKMKEQLVAQLKTQIIDLERFIEFLQDEAATPGIVGQQKCTCNCPVHGKVSPGSFCPGMDRRKQNLYSRQHDEEVRHKTMSMMRRALLLMQMFVVSQLGCGPRQHFHHNVLKQTRKGNHYGDLRARLEMSVELVMECVSARDKPVDSDYTSDSEDGSSVLCNERLTTAIRKDFSSALRDLLQHGLMPVGQSTSLVPFVGCFPVRSEESVQSLHAWDLILKYYEIKHGKQYNATPARKLSQSFNLEIVGGIAITTKQTLLGTIDNIISSHAPFKRSYDSNFKAFVCAALNQGKLVSWLRLILKTRPLLERYYQPWSYVTKTGFEDTFRSLERLNQFTFDLPVDLAVRPFQNIKDVF